MKSLDEVKGLCREDLRSEDQTHLLKTRPPSINSFLFMSRSLQTISEETLLRIFSNSFFVCVYVSNIVQNVHFPAK